MSKSEERLSEIYEGSCDSFKATVSKSDFIKGTWGEPMNPTFFIQEFMKNLKHDVIAQELSGEVAL